MDEPPPSPRRAIEFLMEVNALEGVPRAGWLMSGIRRPEDVAAHTTGVAAAALMIADRVEESVDRGRLLTMALLHDIGEARVGDVALVEKTEADERKEAAAAEEILAGLPSRYREILEEYRAGESLPARIVKAADKVQLMAKVLAYEGEDRGRLAAFWRNLRNFRDSGLPAAKELYAAIRGLREERLGS
jgi:putative hydrolase of HD superfamily